jgi:murein DD-endopeptidase MepM/ murein hydrolase activator NlpD
MKSRKTNGFSAKGYYIALILCAAAIGISGYLYYQNDNNDTPQLNTPTLGGEAQDPDNIQAVATNPSGHPSLYDPTKPNGNTQKPLQTGMPVSGETVMDYAMDCLSYNPTTRDWRVHDGLDIAAEAGSTVCAAAAGTVYTTYTDESMGTTVVIRHDGGYVTTYSSLSSELTVAPGDEVSLGQAIGTVANTALLETAIGDHLHFSVSCDGKSVDPAQFLGLN